MRFKPYGYLAEVVNCFQLCWLDELVNLLGKKNPAQADKGVGFIRRRLKSNSCARSMQVIAPFVVGHGG